MSKIFIEESSLSAIGDAIREKTGLSDKMSPAQMVTAIGSITGGGSVVVGGAEVNWTTIKSTDGKSFDFTPYLDSDEDFFFLIYVGYTYPNDTSTMRMGLAACSLVDDMSCAYTFTTGSSYTTRANYTTLATSGSDGYLIAPLSRGNSSSIGTCSYENRIYTNNNGVSTTHNAILIYAKAGSGSGGGGGITPEGELEITENGTYDVTEYASALVNVASGGGELEPIVLSGSCDYACAGALANAVIPAMAGKITTNNIYQAPYMFNNSGLQEIPFELNFYANYDMSEVNHMFFNADIKKFPTIKNLNPKNASQMFGNCQNLTDIPEGATTTWSFNKWHTSTAAQIQHMFKGCSKLRHIDSNLLKNLWNCNNTYLYNAYYYLFNECTSLDEVRNLGVSTATLTGNAFNSTFNYCRHLKNFTFVSGKSANWKSQTIDLTTVGFFISTTATKSDDFTEDLRVTDLASYEALKDNPAWWTTYVDFSRYNHDSAVATINSLPTITASGATNTIKFEGDMGKGYGKAISDLTDTEIAVATSKGWTVSIT